MAQPKSATLVPPSKSKLIQSREEPGLKDEVKSQPSLVPNPEPEIFEFKSEHDRSTKKIPEEELPKETEDDKISRSSSFKVN